MIVQSELTQARPKWQTTFNRYLTLCKVSFQERMEYRWNTLMYAGVTIVPALVSIFLWTTVFNAGGNPAAVQSICTYYVVATYVNWRIAEFQWEIMMDIREGRMATSLLRPMSYPAKTFWYEIGGRTWSTLLTTPVFVVLAILLGDKFKAPDNFGTWLMAILAFGLAYVLNSFLTMTLGLLTVWQNQPDGIFGMYWVASRWLGGVFVPLAFLPYGIGDWLQWLPFAYIYSLPVRVFQGLPDDKLGQGLAVQAVWMVVAIIGFRWVWRKAMARYEVFEG